MKYWCFFLFSVLGGKGLFIFPYYFGVPIILVLKDPLLAPSQDSGIWLFQEPEQQEMCIHICLNEFTVIDQI